MQIGSNKGLVLEGGGMRGVFTSGVLGFITLLLCRQGPAMVCRI